MIYITGDTHGDLEDFLSRDVKKLRKGDKLIITGDFGFIWNNSKEELSRLEKLKKRKHDILFVEGSSENFAKLKEFPEADLYCGKGIKIARNIYCLKRGEIYTIEGKTVFALGGGLSPYAQPEDFSPSDSMPTDDELQAAVDRLQTLRRRVDLIVTHEAPASLKKLIDRNAAINDLNIFLDTVMKNISYRRWFFGSLHQDRQLSPSITCVYRNVIRVE